MHSKSLDYVEIRRRVEAILSLGLVWAGLLSFSAMINHSSEMELQAESDVVSISKLIQAHRCDGIAFLRLR